MSLRARESFGLYSAGLLWREPDRIKNFLLIFDGIALVTPPGYAEKILGQHEWLSQGLIESDALWLIDPADIFDDDAAVQFISIINEILEDSTLVKALRQASAYQGISINSRFSGLGASVADLMFGEFQKRGLTGSSQSVREYRHIDPNIEEVHVPDLLAALVRSLWSGVVANYARTQGRNTVPVTDDAYEHDYASRVLEPISTMFQEGRQVLRPINRDLSHPILAHLFVGDIHRFAIDVSAIPVAEIIAFRDAHRVKLDAYMNELCDTALRVASIEDPFEQERMVAARVEVLAEQARDLKSRATREFAIQAGELGVAVSAAASAVSHWNPIAALLAGITSAAAATKFFLPEQANQYRYLLVAQERFGYRPWN